MLVSIYSFGSKIEGDVLVNVEEVEEWESFVLRVIFLLVMSTHTPFIFFIGKESLLALLGLLYRKYTKWLKRRKRAKRRAQRKAKAKQNNSQGTSINANRQSTDLRGSLVATETNQNYKIISNSIINGSFERTLSVSSEGSDSDGSDIDSDSGEQSENEIIIMNSVDKNMSSAIGFTSNNADDDLVDSDDYEAETKQQKAIGAEDILPTWIYYTVTLLLYGFVVFSSCFINDVESVIKFIGSLANSTLNYTLPGIYYFLILKRNKSFETPKWKLCIGLFLAIYGFTMGIWWTAINVWTAIHPLPKHH